MATDDAPDPDESDVTEHKDENLGDCCAHGIREDRDCMDCHADGCPGGGSCGCPGNAPRSKRQHYRSTF